jgi:26S proteasome regulatory subunit T1
MVRELFEMARTKKACIIFFDEIDAIGGARFDDGAGGDNEVQRTMLELITQLDGFDPRGNIKVMFATNRPSTLDPALLRPGRIDRKVEFSLPDVEGRTHILKIHAKRYIYYPPVFLSTVGVNGSMSVERDIRFELISRLCPNATGAELRSVCTEAGMFAIRYYYPLYYCMISNLAERGESWRRRKISLNQSTKSSKETPNSTPQHHT